MKYILKTKMLLAMVLLIVSMTFALSAHSKSKPLVIGYLIDRQCMAAISSSDNPIDFITAHTKDCILMSSCRQGGYAVYLPEKKRAINLDQKGNRLAIKYLESSKRNSAFYVQIRGHINQNVLNVKSIKEMRTPSKISPRSNK